MIKGNKSFIKEEVLLDVIIDAIQDIKGEKVIEIDLSGINNSICSHFIICHGNSNTQVTAISDSVRRKTKEKLGYNPYFVDGYLNAEWIILDYGDVMVHVFQRSVRALYDLESLWEDAKIRLIEEELLIK